MPQAKALGVAKARDRGVSRVGGAHRFGVGGVAMLNLSQEATAVAHWEPIDVHLIFRNAPPAPKVVRRGACNSKLPADPGDSLPGCGSAPSFNTTFCGVPLKPLDSETLAALACS